MKIGDCLFPDDLVYSPEENVWVRKEPDAWILGITSAHAFLAGTLTAVRFKPVGTGLEAGKSVATLESARFFGAVRTPVGGRIMELNGQLLDAPVLANRDPYGRGWFARIQPTAEDGRHPEGLVSSGEAEARFRRLIEGLHLRCFSHFPDHEVSGIGGECPETLSTVDELLRTTDDGAIVHLVTDNPVADRDVPRWVATRRYSILEARREGSLAHFLIGKRPPAARPGAQATSGLEVQG